MAFELTEALQVIKIENILFLILSGVALAATIITTNYFHIKQGKRNTAIASTAATIISIPILLPLFENRPIFISMMMFYLAGLITVTYLSKIEEKEGILEKLSSGWNISKKMIYLLAIGGLIIPLLMTATTLEYRQEQFKESMIDITESQIEEIDLAEMIDPEEIDIGSKPGNMTKEEFKEDILLPQIKMTGMPMDYETWENMTEEEREVTLEYLYEEFMEEQEDIDETIEETFSRAIEQQLEDIETDIMRPMMEQMFEEIPIFNLTLRALPIITALVVSSLILLHGTIFVYPFFALMSLIIPIKQEKKEKEEDKKD